MSVAHNLPEDLQRYVVEQDYTRYDAADQATWRFVMLHLQAHLERVAHPVYTQGLKVSALTTERIPCIAEMDAALSRLGWGAVAVDGFIPPRVFQRFQALSILPIAADIRTPQHVAYTPAPDIIHEAAGHAPILVDQDYSEYLRRSGAAGELAFSSREDHDVYRAIAHLSRVKELLPQESPEVRRAEQRLQAALDATSLTTEAARMARLYWWTAEYGLVGTPSRFALYGAGLLSSLGEAVYCLDQSVKKLPLDVSCLDQGYDITRPQPQLYVTPTFAALFDVLGEALSQLAANRGVQAAAAAAQASLLPAWLCLSNGQRLRGVLQDWDRRSARPRFVELLTDNGLTLVLFAAPGESCPPAPEQPDAVKGTVQRFRCQNGLELEANIVTAAQARSEVWQLENARLFAGGAERHFAHAELWPGVELEGVLPADDIVEQETTTRARIAPLPRQLNASEKHLRALYELAHEAWRRHREKSCLPAFEQVHRTLQKEYPDEWLLRWNLLENLLQLGERAHTSQLVDELELLEIKFRGREPIATGLRSLRTRVRASDDPQPNEVEVVP